jgi:hypothetical protein
MIRHTWLPIAALVVLATAAGASPADRWIHVKVIESAADSGRVSINLPLTLVESLLPVIESHGLKAGKIQLDLADSHVDLKALRAALAKANDGEYVTVENADEHVRVFKERDCLRVHSEDPTQTVEVRIPLKVVDAFLSAGGEELDLHAALRELAKQDENTELIRVEGGGESVRIWIDRQPTMN